MSKKVKEEVERENQHLLQLKENYHIPRNLKSVEYSYGFGDLPLCPMFIWIEDDGIHFLAVLPEPKQIILPMIDFDGYSKQGSFVREEFARQTRAPIESIMLNLFRTVFIGQEYARNTDVFVDDQRMTVLEVRFDGNLRYIFFEGHELYLQLREEIPEKELL